MTVQPEKRDDAPPAVRHGLGLASRPVLKRADVSRQPGAHLAVAVRLRVGRQNYEGASEGVGLETMELRLAAEATMDAIHAVIGAERFQLVGIKRMHAFDADVILVALRDRRADGQRYIGAVPVRSTLVHGAAAAVLDATNRILTAPAE